MARRTIRVQHYRARSCYAKKVGRHRGADGIVRPKVWYLTDCSEHEAVARAATLKTAWKQLRALGHDTWPEGYQPPWKLRPTVPAESASGMSAALDVVATQTRTSSEQSPLPSGAGRVRRVAPGDLLVGDAFELFKRHYEAEAAAGRVSPGRAANARNFVGKSVAYLGKTTPLHEVGRAQLEDLVRHWIGRPKKTLPSGKKGDPISADYAKSLVVNAATFFRWIDEHERIPWRLPPNAPKLFEVGNIAPATEAERKARHGRAVETALEVFSIADLTALYGGADPALRAWLLLGLNCAFTQVDISDLRRYEIDHDRTPPLIQKWREKTLRHKKDDKPKIDAKYVLWPETVAALRAAMAGPNEHERAFLAADGGILVSRERRSDAIGRAFYSLKERIDMGHAPSFKHLRKTSATAIYRLSGSREIQEAHLAHTEKWKMAEPYADRLWATVNEWQMKMRQEFQEVWS